MPSKVDLHKLQSCLGQDQLQGRKKKWDSSTLACGFGIDHVNEGSYEVTSTPLQNSAVLSLLGNIDPYWESQLLVEYSKNLFTCKVLDGQVTAERYRVVDGVIYFQDRIYLTRDPKLKEKILHTAHEVLFSRHVETYHTIMEGLY